MTRTWMTSCICGLGLLFAAEAAPAQERVRLEAAWTLPGAFSRPESVVYDPARDVLYVSNINGEGAAKDGNGFISRVSPQGRVISLKWVDGLDAPKGLALHGNRLYVSDIDRLLEIDTATGRVVARHAVEGDPFLNDVAVDEDGTVYVSDSRRSVVYRLRDGRFEPWLRDNDALLMPNGVHVVGGRLIVAAGDAGAENPGGARYLHSVSLETGESAPLRDRTGLGSLDAVEPDGRGGLFLTDWGGGRILHFTPSGGAVSIEHPGLGTADLEYVHTSRMLYVPVMMRDLLIAYRVVEDQ